MPAACKSHSRIRSATKGLIWAAKSPRAHSPPQTKWHLPPAFVLYMRSDLVSHAPPSFDQHRPQTQQKHLRSVVHRAHNQLRKLVDYGRGANYLLRAHLPARLGCQGGLDRYAAEPAARPNAPATSADTETGMALRVRRWPRVRMRCCSRRNRSTSGLLLRTNYTHCVHHMQGGADDVTELLMAALTASARANRPWQRRQLLPLPPLPLPCDASPARAAAVGERMRRPCRPEPAYRRCCWLL